MEGLLLSGLSQISHPKGDIFHALKATDESYQGFGEAYFSFVKKGEVKGWKCHTQMALNLVVPQGEIRFVVFDDREGSQTHGEYREIVLSPDNYKRLTIAPNLWVAFQGRGQGESMLLNIASLPHDPEESVNREINDLPYDWTLL